MLGIGGGVIFIPTLYFILPSLETPESILPFIVIATSVFAGALASASGFIKHLQNKNVFLKRALIVGSGSCLAAFIGPLIIVNFDPSIPKHLIGFILLIIAVNMLIGDRLFHDTRMNISDSFLFVFGLLIGFLSSITGIGGGVLFVPIFLYIYHMEMKRAIGTSIMAVALTMLSSTISYMFFANNAITDSHLFGYVNIYAGISLGVSSIFGAVFGANLVKRINVAVLKKIFSVFLILVVIKLLTI